MRYIFLCIGIFFSISDSLFAMNQAIISFKKDLNTKVSANDLNGVVEVVKKFHNFLLTLKADQAEQQELCNVLFDDSIKHVLNSKNNDFQLTCFILEGAGYSVNDFLKQRKDNLPQFILNSSVYKSAFKNAEAMHREEGHLRDSFKFFSNIGKFYQIISNSVAKLFLNNESNLNTIIAERYQRASTESFDPDVIAAINIFCHNTFLHHFMTEVLERLYKAQNDAELVESLVALITLTQESKGDALALIMNNLEVSKIFLVKNFMAKFSTFCHQEEVLGTEAFLKNDRLSFIAKFIDRLDERFEKVAASFGKENAPKNLGNILDILQVSIINYIFSPIFKQFKNNNCLATLDNVLSLAGPLLLQGNRFKYFAPTHLIDIKKLRDADNKWIITKLNTLVTRLMYSYLTINMNIDEIVFSLIQLGNMGFRPQELIHDLIHAAAIILKVDQKLFITQRIDELMHFINNSSLTSKYKFERYRDLLGQYSRTHELINKIKANSSEASILLLLNAGVQINMLDFDEQSPLLYAIESGNLQYVQLLLSKGADVNLARGDGVTPLMMAIQHNNSNIVKLLLERGADLTSKNTYGQDVWTLVKKNNAIVSLLKDAEKKAPISFQDKLNAFRELSTRLNSLSQAAQRYLR